MKRLSLLILVLVFSISVFAQEKIIDKSEFDKAMADNYKVLRNQPHRIIEESIYDGLGEGSKNKTVTEVNGLARYFILEFDSRSTYSKTESILINNKRYTKKLDQNWVVEDITPPSKIPFSNIEITEAESVYKFLGEKIVEGKTFKIYQSIIKRILKNKNDSSEANSIDITDYLFDETGLMVKSESNIERITKYPQDSSREFIRKDSKSSSKIIRKVEIDHNIKIEAPQIV